jgi:nuclear transcription factor Y, gamma
MYVLYTIRADWTGIVFITEITARAFIVADANKRRTLSRADIAKALGRSDQFDFLIDVVPRDEVVFSERGQSNQGQGSTSGSVGGANAEDANEDP